MLEDHDCLAITPSSLPQTGAPDEGQVHRVRASCKSVRGCSCVLRVSQFPCPDSTDTELLCTGRPCMVSASVCLHLGRVYTANNNNNHNHHHHYHLIIIIRSNKRQRGLTNLVLPKRYVAVGARAAKPSIPKP